MAHNGKSKIGKATAWSSVTELMAKIIAPLVNIVLARLLTPEAFGAVATVTVVISFAELFADAGFQKYLVQHEFADKESLDNSTHVAFWTNLALSVTVTAVIVLFRHPLAALCGSEGLGDAIGVASLSIVLYAFSSIQTARYKRDFDFKTLFFARIGSALIPLLVTVPLALWLRNYWALVIGTLAVNAFNAVVLTVRSPWKLKWFYDFGLLREMFSYSVWLLCESMLTWLVSSVDVFLVGRFLNDWYLGLYKTATATVNSYLGIITAAVLPVLFSALSRAQNDEPLFRRTFFTFQRLTGVLLLPMGVGLWVFRDTVTQILLGEQWLEAADFIGLWSVMTVAVTLTGTFFGEVYRSQGKTKIAALSQAINLVFLIPTVFISAQYGFTVLYIARALVRIPTIIKSFIFMRCLFKFRLREMVKNLVSPLLCAAVMGLFGFWLRSLYDAFWWQLCAVALCVVLYFGLLMLFPAMRRDLSALPFVRRLCKKNEDNEEKKEDTVC